MKKSPLTISAVSTLLIFTSLGNPTVLMAQDSEQPVVCPIACGYSIEELDNILAPSGSSLNPYECLSISRDRFMDGFPARERGRVINELNVNDKDGKSRGAQVIFSKPPGFNGGLCQIYEKGLNDPEVAYEKPAFPSPKEKGTIILKQVEGLTLEQVVACHNDIMNYAQERFTSNKDMLCF